MEPITIGILLLIALVVLLFLGIPVSTTIGALGLLGMVLLRPSSFLIKVGIASFESINSYNNTVLPLFALMAMVICHTGIGGKLYEAFYKLVGRFPGGLAIATILACGIFAAVSSSSSVTALTIGLIALPEMRKVGYKDSLIAGSISAGGTLGPFIPPSSPMIVYAIATGTSIIDLFLAGIVPGLVCIVLYSITILIICKRIPGAGPKAPKYSAKEVLIAFSKCGEIIILIALVLGGMFAGWFTPTEAAAIGAAGSIIITLIRRVLTWQNFMAAVKGAMKNCGMIYAIFIASDFMNYFMTYSRFPVTVAGLLSDLAVPPMVVVIFMVIILMFLGCIMDGLGMLMLTLPIFFPVVQQLGLDPIWFGLVMVTCIEMAVITPPVGVNLFVVKNIDKSMNMGDIYKGAYPFFASQILALILFLIFPQIVTFLPSIAG